MSVHQFRSGFQFFVLEAALAAGLLSVPAHGQATFQGLGDLPGGGILSQAHGVSADGSVIVGWSKSASGDEAFLWTSGGGMVNLGDLPGGIVRGAAYAASADGAVVVGEGFGTNGNEAFMWTSGSGMVGLGDLEGSAFFSKALGVSNDGTVVVGFGAGPNGGEAFLWTNETGMDTFLGDRPPGDFESIAYDVRGSTLLHSVVGSFTNASGSQEAFRWTTFFGLEALGDLPGGDFMSVARGFATNGVVGSSVDALGRQAVRWEDDEIIGLGELAGGFYFSEALAASSVDTVVGWSFTALGEEAFIWDAEGGMQNLKDVLQTTYGLDLTGWQLWRATGISADGNVIVGYGITGVGFVEGWVVDLSGAAAPCPQDFDTDGEVGVLDLLALLAVWGPCPGCPEDTDGNGEVDVLDLIALLAAWGPCL